MPFGRARKKAAPLDEAALYDYALQALGRRSRSVAELKRLLRSRVEGGEAGEARIDAVVARLKEYKFLNDEAFAADYARLRQENERFGRRRVEQDLKQKGVGGEVASTALDAAYGDVSEEELVRRHIERRRMKKPSDEKETARLVRRLVRAGFSAGAIFKVLRNWQVDAGALEGLELLEDEDGGE